MATSDGSFVRFSTVFLLLVDLLHGSTPSLSLMSNKLKKEKPQAQKPLTLEWQEPVDLKNEERFETDLCSFLSLGSNISEHNSNRTQLNCTVFKFIFCSMDYKTYVTEKCSFFPGAVSFNHKTTWRNICDSLLIFFKHCPSFRDYKPSDTSIQIFFKRLKRYTDSDANIVSQSQHQMQKPELKMEMKENEVINMPLIYEKIINLIKKHIENSTLLKISKNNTNHNVNNQNGARTDYDQNKASSLERIAMEAITISENQDIGLQTTEAKFNINVKIVKRNVHKNSAESTTLTLDRNMTKEYRDLMRNISIQNSKDPMWALLCVIFISILVLFAVLYSRMCIKRKKRDLIYIDVEEHLRSETVFDVIRRKARFLPLFQHMNYHQLSSSDIVSEDCFSSSDTLSDTMNTSDSKLSSIDESSEDEFTTLSQRHQVDIEREFTELSHRNNENTSYPHR